MLVDIGRRYEGELAIEEVAKKARPIRRVANSIFAVVIKCSKMSRAIKEGKLLCKTCL